ncbi:hypothetical protein COW46_00120 [Candidatus Gracilibacteria bacterium CG17_big_fil_post_rev_8_21_14_2_50_48_13]|nr:MAG: hypothetical protein COW46_00120 [Candidatus Gracilibacteria bacterium CG17_big_fil_post_rev_8_21_14_2_50_48_13]
MIARLFGSSWTSIARNSLLSLGAFSVVLLVSFFLFVVNSGGVLLDRTVADVQNNVEFTVFLKKGVSVDNALVSELKTGLTLLGTEVQLLTSKEALDLVKASTNIPDLIDQTVGVVQTYEGENILEPVMIIKNVARVDANRITALLKDPKFAPAIDFSYFDEQLSRVQNLSSVTTSAQVIFIVLYVLFLAIASLILFNTSRILLFTRKDEIQIMQLVGASRKTIEGPFYGEAILLSVFGVLAAFLIFVLVLFQWHAVVAGAFSGTAGAQVMLLHVGDILTTHVANNALVDLGKMLLLLAFVAVLSTWYALRTYLPRI